MSRSPQSRKRGRVRLVQNAAVSTAVTFFLATTQSFFHMECVDASPVHHGIGISHLADRMRKAEDIIIHSSLERGLIQKFPDQDDEPERRTKSSGNDVGIYLGISTTGKGRRHSSKSTKSYTSGSSNSKESSKSGKSSKSSKSQSNDEQHYYDDFYGGGGGDDDDDDDDNNGDDDDDNDGGDDDDDNDGGGDDDDDDNNGGDDDDDNDGGDDDDDDDNNDGGDDDDDDDGDDDDDDDDNRPNAAPVHPPTMPSPNQVPSTMAPINGPPSIREPTTMPGGPTLPPTQPRCPLSGDGLFGSAVGLPEELKFYYQVQVVPSVTIGEMNLNLLNKLEQSIGEGVLPRIFDQCVSSSSTFRTSTQGNRHLRTLQPVELEGFSTRPRDTVIEEVDCVNVEQVYPCYVIRGQVTTYSPRLIPDTTIERLNSALQAAVESDETRLADNRVTGVSWRDIDSDPIPGEEEPDDDGDGGDDDDDDDDEDDGDSPTLSPVAAPTDKIPIIRESKKTMGLETWSIGLIAAGGFLLLCTLFLCLRRSKHEPIVDMDDGENDGRQGGSTGSDKFRQEPYADTKKMTPLVASTKQYQPPAPLHPAPPPPSPPATTSATTTTPYRDIYSVPPSPKTVPANPFKEPETTTTTPYRDIYSVPPSPKTVPANPFKEPETMLAVGNTAQMEDVSSEGSGSGSEQSGQRYEDEYDDEEDDEYGDDDIDEGVVSANDSRANNAASPRYNDSQDGNSTQNSGRGSESSGNEFSSQYADEEVEEEYEVEYVEDEGGGSSAENDDNEEEEYVDEYGYDDEDEEAEDDDGDYDDDEYDEDQGSSSYTDDADGIVVDSPGGTPILPWLAQDD